MRISKRFVLGTSALLAVGGLAALGGLVAELQRDLEELRAQSDVRDSELTDLRQRLGEVGRQVVDVRALEAEARARLLEEIESRSDTQAAAVQRELSTLGGRVQALRDAAEEHARLLAAARADDNVELRYRELMSPTVRINARHEVGSGTILWSRQMGKRARTYVLTAWHIVQDNMSGDGPMPLEVDFYEDGELLRTERGEIVAFQEELDLALLEVRGYSAYPRQARLPTREQLDGVQVFSRVYAIGCPLGYSPLPTSGELTSKDKELDGNHYWMVNAPTIFGNSGGGIYLARCRTMLGVLSRISAYKSMIDVAVPHMGLVTPLSRVYDWLQTTPYAYVYVDRLAEEAEARDRVEPSTVPASTPAGD